VDSVTSWTGTTHIRSHWQTGTGRYSDSRYSDSRYYDSRYSDNRCSDKVVCNF